MTRVVGEELQKRLAEWLTKRLAPQGGLKIHDFSVAKGGGFSAETIVIDVEYPEDGKMRRRGLIARRQNEGTDLFLDASLELPCRVMQALSERNVVPVPKIIGLETDRSIASAPFVVMEKCAGRALPQVPNYNKEGWLKDMPIEKRAAVWKNALQMMVRVHKHDWHDGFEFLNRPERGSPGLDQYLKWVEEWYLWARRDRPHPITDIALQRLKETRPHNAAVGLLWGDPTPANILFANDGSIEVLLDWEMATLGPPEADLAWWFFLDELWSTGMGVAHLPGLPDRPATIAYYESLLGRSVENMEYYDLLARFRMAIIGMRSVDRQIDRGIIPATTTARTNAPIMRMLAAYLGEPLPEIGKDFATFAASIGMH